MNGLGSMDANAVARGGGTAGFFVDFVGARLHGPTEKGIIVNACNTEADQVVTLA
jgi:hypothetical protein